MRGELAQCITDRFFVEALPEHFSTHEEGLARSAYLLERLRRMSGAI